MFTFIVLCIVGYLWYVANKNYEKSGSWTHRRQRAGYAWALAGAIIGSFFGVAGFGSAIAGTIPGAFIGYLLASNMMKKDADPRS